VYSWGDNRKSFREWLSAAPSALYKKPHQDGNFFGHGKTRLLTIPIWKALILSMNTLGSHSPSTRPIKRRRQSSKANEESGGLEGTNQEIDSYYPKAACGEKVSDSWKQHPVGSDDVLRSMLRRQPATLRVSSNSCCARTLHLHQRQ
jgi:hypothetical protein